MTPCILKSAVKFTFFAGIVVTAHFCSPQLDGNRQSAGSSASVLPIETVSPVPSPKDSTERYESSGFTVVKFQNEPIALLQLEFHPVKDPKQAQVTLLVQNVSEKTVRLVTYGMGVSNLCTEFMYVMVPTPQIGYGDWQLLDGPATGNSHTPSLKPGEKVTIKISKDTNLSRLLNPKTYASCPEGHKNPELMLQNVYFEDGSVWKPHPANTSP